MKLSELNKEVQEVMGELLALKEDLDGISYEIGELGNAVQSVAAKIGLAEDTLYNLFGDPNELG